MYNSVVLIIITDLYNHKHYLCSYNYERYKYGLKFSLDVFIWFWYQGNAGLISLVRHVQSSSTFFRRVYKIGVNLSLNI